MRAAVSIVIALLTVSAVEAQNQSHRASSTDSPMISRPISTFNTGNVRTTTTNMMLPADHYCRGLGFFCREELKLQKAKIPMIFRVGNVDDCNKLEQKPGYR